VQQPAPHNKHREFMSHHPLVFTHADDPLEAEDWLKTVLKMLTTCQCDDRENVMYAAGRLQGSTSAWWDAFVAAHAAPDNITWDEFTTNFRSHHIPSGVMKIKKKAFLSLKQDGMSVAEYRDKFIELSRSMLHEYGYGYPIQYVSDTWIHTFSKENPLKWCIRVSVSAYPASIGYGYVTLFGVSV
jgi:hypothetical protein